jgi:hypothetical protein
MREGLFLKFAVRFGIAAAVSPSPGIREGPMAAEDLLAGREEEPDAR